MTVFEVLKWGKANPFQSSIGHEWVYEKVVTGAVTLATTDARAVSVNTTAAPFTVTLPSAVYPGLEYRIFDGLATGSWSINSLTISGNGRNIILSGAGPAASVTLSTGNGSIRLRYSSTLECWQQTA